MSFKEMIFPQVEASALLEFKRFTLKENFNRIKALAIVVILLDFVLGLSNILFFLFQVEPRYQYKAYLVSYLVIIFANILMLLFIHKTGKQPELSEKQVDRKNRVLLAYITFMLCWGSCVTLMDQNLYVQLTVFMVNMIAYSSLCYLDTKRSLVPFFASITLLMAGLPFFQHSFEILVGHYINLSIFVILSFICSRALYYHHCQNFDSKLMLNRAYAKQRKLSYTDDLTSLPNRRSYSQYIEEIFLDTLASDTLVSVVMLDIDHFKQYNDCYGHMDGDTVLIRVAREIELITDRADTFAARIGGEEFICITKGKTAKEILATAEKLRQKIIGLNILHPHSDFGYLTVSLGISDMVLSHKEDLYTCVRQADKALYHAKKSGRNCITIYEESMAEIK